MPDQDTAPAPGRAGGPLRALIASAVGLFATHVELVGIELLEEKERLRELAVLGAVALLGLGMALLALSALLVVAFWDSHRLLVLGLLCAGYAGLGIWGLAALRRRLAGHPHPFAVTVAELAKDRERLHQ